MQCTCHAVLITNRDDSSYPFIRWSGNETIYRRGDGREQSITLICDILDCKHGPRIKVGRCFFSFGDDPYSGDCVSTLPSNDTVWLTSVTLNLTQILTCIDGDGLIPVVCKTMNHNSPVSYIDIIDDSASATTSSCAQSSNTDPATTVKTTVKTTSPSAIHSRNTFTVMYISKLLVVLVLVVHVIWCSCSDVLTITLALSML